MPDQGQDRTTFESCLAIWMDRFLIEKHACGYAYFQEEYRLRQLDRFLSSEGFAQEELPKLLVERWTARRQYERGTTQQSRVRLVRQFALFLIRQGVSAFVPDPRLIAGSRSQFCPWIFSRSEIRRMLEASDHIPFDKRSPFRQRTMPEIFRLLYGCGLRRGEPLSLNVADVDLDQGFLRVRQSKGKDRLVPVAPSLRERLQRYDEAMGHRTGDVPFFPGPDGQQMGGHCAYRMFRHLLAVAGISHRGRGEGPRLHDLRATFAVHRLESWYRQGADLGVKLPVLSTYMGHMNLSETQRYLRLTAELYPDITSSLESIFGHVIPRLEETYQ